MSVLLPHFFCWFIFRYVVLRAFVKRGAGPVCEFDVLPIKIMEKSRPHTRDIFVVIQFLKKVRDGSTLIFSLMKILIIIAPHLYMLFRSVF